MDDHFPYLNEEQMSNWLGIKHLPKKVGQFPLVRLWTDGYGPYSQETMVRW